MEVSAVPAAGRRVEQPAGAQATSTVAPGTAVTSRSTRSYSRPRPQETASAPAGTASATSRAWKYGRWVASHLCGTPSGNHAPPLGSVTDHRAQCGAVNRRVAAGKVRTAPWSMWRRPSTSTSNGPATSTVAMPAPPGGTRTSSPATVTVSGRLAAESTTTSTATGVPAMVPRAGPTRRLTSPAASTRTTTTPAGGSAPTTSRTADGQSPVRCTASKTGPSSENRAQRNTSGSASSPQPQPSSASSRR